jgi:hypothetical protein
VRRLTCIVLSLAAGLAVGQEPDMHARYRAAEQFEGPELGRLVYKARLEPHWIAGTSRFWYRNDVRGEREFILVDADAGTRKLAFSHARLARALSELLGNPHQAEKLPFRAIEFVDSATMRFRVGSQHFRCDLRTYAVEKSEAPPEPEESGEDEERDEREPGTSPDGKWVAGPFFGPNLGLH